MMSKLSYLEIINNSNGKYYDCLSNDGINNNNKQQQKAWTRQQPNTDSMPVLYTVVCDVSSSMDRYSSVITSRDILLRICQDIMRDCDYLSVYLFGMKLIEQLKFTGRRQLLASYSSVVNGKNSSNEKLPPSSSQPAAQRQAQPSTSSMNYEYAEDDDDEEDNNNYDDNDDNMTTTTRPDAGNSRRMIDDVIDAMMPTQQLLGQLLNTKHTALYDAIGQSMGNILDCNSNNKSNNKEYQDDDDENVIKMMKSSNNCQRVLVIITDGHDNASKAYSVEKLRKIIENPRMHNFHPVIIGLKVHRLKADLLQGICYRNKAQFFNCQTTDEAIDRLGSVKAFVFKLMSISQAVLVAEQQQTDVNNNNNNNNHNGHHHQHHHHHHNQHHQQAAVNHDVKAVLPVLPPPIDYVRVGDTERPLPFLYTLVCDISDSVHASGKAQVIRESVSRFVRKVMRDCDYLELLTYGSRVVRHFGLTKRNDIELGRVNELLMQKGDRSALYDAICFAIATMNNDHRYQHYSRLLIVLTDCEDNFSKDFTSEKARYNVEYAGLPNFRMLVLGLQQVASINSSSKGSSGHHYSRKIDSSAIEAICRSSNATFSQVSSASNAVVQLEQFAASMRIFCELRRLVLISSPSFIDDSSNNNNNNNNTEQQRSTTASINKGRSNNNNNNDLLVETRPTTTVDDNSKKSPSKPSLVVDNNNNRMSFKLGQSSDDALSSKANATPSPPSQQAQSSSSSSATGNRRSLVR